MKVIADVGLPLAVFYLCVAAAVVVAYGLGWLLAPRCRHLTRSTVLLKARWLLLPEVAVLLVFAALMEVTDGWWAVAAAAGCALAGEAAYQVRAPRLLYRLFGYAGPLRPLPENFRRDVQEWRRATTREVTNGPISFVLAVAGWPMWLAWLTLRTLLPLWAPNWFVSGSSEGGGGA